MYYHSKKAESRPNYNGPGIYTPYFCGFTNQQHVCQKLIRNSIEVYFEVRTPDGTILDSSFPTSESAHMALAALDEMRRKEKKCTLHSLVVELLHLADMMSENEASKQRPVFWFEANARQLL